MRNIILIVVLILCGNNVFAQLKPLDFSTTGLCWNLPKGYNNYDSDNLFASQNNILHNLPYRFKPLTGDYVICLAYDLYSKDTEQLIRSRHSPSYDNNSNSWRRLSLSADTLNTKIEYLDRELISKKINADRAGFYQLKFSVNNPMYDGKYDQCKVFFMHKKDIGFFSIYYFYKTGDTVGLQKKIEKTMYMFQFKKAIDNVGKN